MSKRKCPDCNATILDGRVDCQEMWDEIAAQVYGNLQYAAVRDLAFDAYCMQHLDKYCHSAKSYAAHLTRLCCGIEYQGDPTIYAAIQRWLNGNMTIKKPHTLPFLGSITVADLLAVHPNAEQMQLAQSWAESVWEAYASQQELARGWIRSALDDKGSHLHSHS